MFFKSLLGVLEEKSGSCQSWWWCQGARRTPRKLHKKFRQNQTTGSMWNGHFYKNMFCGGLFFASRAPLIHFEWIQKLSNPPHFIHGERWCVQKNPTSKHLSKEHFFWDTLYIRTGEHINCPQNCCIFIDHVVLNLVSVSSQLPCFSHHSHLWLRLLTHWKSKGLLRHY